MDTTTLIITIWLSTINIALAVFAILYPIRVSNRLSNRTEDKLNEFIKIIAGIDIQTKNILNEIRNSNRTQIEDSFMNFKEEIKPILKEGIYLQAVKDLTRNKISGLSNSIDMNLNNISFSGASPSPSPSPSMESSPRILGSKPLDIDKEKSKGK